MAFMRLPPLMLRPGYREELERRVRSHTIEARCAERARLVLLAADGWSNRAIGEAIGMLQPGRGVATPLRRVRRGRPPRRRTAGPAAGVWPRRRAVVGQDGDRTTAGQRHPVDHGS